MFLLPIKVTESDHVTRTFNVKKKKLCMAHSDVDL